MRFTNRLIGVAALVYGLGGALLLSISVPLSRAQSQEVPLEIIAGVSDKNNTSQTDEDGDTPAFLVIRNNTPNAVTFVPPPIDLGGWFLSDDPNQPTKWQFPDKTLIGAQGELVVFASGKDRRPGGGDGQLHTNFIYPCDIPFAGLYNTDGVLVSQFANRDEACAECRGVSLFTEKTIARFHVPEDDGLAGLWMQPGFDAADWARGPLGIGYENLDNDPICEGLILYATMDRADMDARIRLVRDVSGPTVHDGTADQELGLVPGQVGEGLGFDKGQGVSFGSHSELDPGRGSMSVAIWARALAGENQLIVAKGGLNENSPGWALIDTGKELVMQVSLGGQGLIRLPMERLNPEEWTHLTMVIDRSAKLLRGYRNGAPIGDVELPGDVIAAPEVELRAGSLGRGVAQLTGALDEFAIWRRALGEDEVAGIFKAGIEGRGIECRSGSSGGGGPIYGSLIGTDVSGPMRGVNSSIYIRVPFSIPDPTLIGKLDLLMRYDDGFVCYLNGTEVARRNAPSSSFLPFNAASLGDRPDLDALAQESISLNGALGLLAPGENILAIHGLNSARDAARFLIFPQLCVETVEPQDCVKTTNGRDFWLTFPGNAPEDTENPLALTVSVAGVPGTTGRVEIPGLEFLEEFVIPANGPMENTGCVTVKLPPEATLDEEGVVKRNGVHVTANRDVAVYGTTRIDYSTDSFLGLPTGCLGRRYVALGYKNVWNDLPILNGSQIGLVGVFDGTKVIIRPSAAAGGGAPIEITLNRGETYLARNVDDLPADLSGSIVESTLPVGLFAGHRCANINSRNAFFCDTLIEHLLPVAAWGTQYYSAPLQTRTHNVAANLGDTLRLAAARDNTFVNVTDDAGSANIVLNAGDVHEQLVIGPARIASEFPVLAAIYSNSSDFDLVTNSDPFMASLQPLANWMSRYLICAPPTAGGVSDFEENYVNIIARSASDASTIRLNGAGIAGFQPLGATGFMYAQVKLNSALTQHLIESSRGARFAVTVYGFSEFDSYGYPGGMQFDRAAAPVVICPPDMEIFLEEGCEAPAPDLRGLTRVFDPCTGGEIEPDPTGETGCFEFEDLSLQSQFGIGQSFVTVNEAGSESISATVEPFVFANGQTSTSGSASVQSGGQAGATGNELFVGNVNLRFKPSSPWTGFSIRFGEFGGNVNFEVNGDLRVVNDFLELNGLAIGGTQVAVVATAGAPVGEIRVTGAVREFAIGGQELFVDRLCSGAPSSGFGIGTAARQSTVGASATVTQDPPPGSALPAGEHEVTLTVRNANGGLVGTCVTTVRVVDPSPIRIECPTEEIVLRCVGEKGARAVYEGVRAITEKCGVEVPLICDPPPGTLLPVGITTVRCKAISASGESAECEFKVRVDCEGIGGEFSRVTIQISEGGVIQLAWPAGGALEKADTIGGAWRRVTGASSPFTVETTGASGFYRVRF